MSDRWTRQGQSRARSAERRYVDRCTIRRVGKSKGTDGGNTNRETILATGVPVKLEAASAEERQIAGATEGSTVYKVRIPYWQSDAPIDLDSTCYLDIAARGEVEAQTLSVVAPLSGSGTKLDAVAVRQS